VLGKQRRSAGGDRCGGAELPEAAARQGSVWAALGRCRAGGVGLRLVHAGAPRCVGGWGWCDRPPVAGVGCVAGLRGLRRSRPPARPSRRLRRHSAAHPGVPSGSR
jgi:hypothetical protein